jgi:type I restriction enzyme, S subunit
LKVVRDMSRQFEETWTAHLRDVCTSRRGVSYTKKDLLDEEKDGCAYMINLKSFSKQGKYRPEGIKFFGTIVDSKHTLNDQHVLVANTDLTAEGDILGAAVMLPPSLWGKKTIGSHHTTVLTVTDERVIPSYLMTILNTHYIRLQVRRYRRGATIKGINNKDLMNLELTFPPRGVQEQIMKIIKKYNLALDGYEAFNLKQNLALRSFILENVESLQGDEK